MTKETLAQTRAAVRSDPALDHVLDMIEVAALANLSMRTFERLVAQGDGPTMTRLSRRRVGFRYSDVCVWLDQRAVA